MSDWVWFLAYEHGDARIALADRDTVGGICDAAGTAALNLSARSWPWRIGLGSLLHRSATGLLEIAERHTRTAAAFPADSHLLAELARQGLIDGDDS